MVLSVQGPGMVSYYCTACWYVSPYYQKRCPSCGSADRFYTEQKYAELMMRYLHHPLRKYRIFALKNIKQLKWKDAIPELQERIRIETDPDVRAEAKRTLESVQNYLNRTETSASSPSQPGTHMYANMDETKCKVIPIRRVLHKHGHYHLRPNRFR